MPYCLSWSNPNPLKSCKPWDLQLGSDVQVKVEWAWSTCSSHEKQHRFSKNRLPGVLLSPLPLSPAHLHHSVSLEGMGGIWRKMIANHSPLDFQWPFLGKEVVNDPTISQAGHIKIFASLLKHCDWALLLQLPHSVPSDLLLSHASNMSLLPGCSGALEQPSMHLSPLSSGEYPFPS